MFFGNHLKKIKGYITVAVLICFSLVGTSILTLPGLTSASAEAQAASVTTKTLASTTKYQKTPLYIIDSGKPGPVVMIVGGVHGNEPAGYQAAERIKNLKVKKGKLLVIPRANIVAVKNGTRGSSGVSDLNRHFPTTKNGKARTNTAQSIWDTIKAYDVDYLIDLHEGYDYHKINSKSYGQTLIYYPVSSSQTVGQKIINKLNSRIASSSKHFTLVRYPYPGTLARSTAQYLGINSFILETCRKSPLSVRIDNGVIAAQTLLTHLGMY
ncbi:MAG: hypothetical protein GXY50_03615 [Syntrophomonadaceae bacterium]|nr:hypothetical protein [Syntrophomonadaceae bacterium]